MDKYYLAVDIGASSGRHMPVSYTHLGIGPGYIATPQTAPLREVQADGSRHPFDQFIISKTPAARWGTPEDLQGPAVFLASDASRCV